MFKNGRLKGNTKHRDSSVLNYNINLRRSGKEVDDENSVFPEIRTQSFSRCSKGQESVSLKQVKSREYTRH